MYAWEQIQLTLDYIENHIDEQINIESLANLASLSPFYYQRLFSRLVKIPVGEYIKQRRLSLSLDKLKGNSKILDVALDLGFSTHEHFTKSFKSAFSMTPEEYKKSSVLLNYITKPDLSLNYTIVNEGVPIISDNIVLEINRQTLSEPIYYMGLSVLAPISFIEGQGTQSGPDPLENIWNNLHLQKYDFPNLDEAEELGVTLPSIQEAYFKYFAGAKLKSKTISNISSTSNEIWTLPKGSYLVCSIEAESFKALVTDVLYKALNYLYVTWIPSHNLKTDYFCAERYFFNKKETQHAQLWIKIID